jgi:hypothetical protein
VHVADEAEALKFEKVMTLSRPKVTHGEWCKCTPKGLFTLLVLMEEFKLSAFDFKLWN